MHILIWCYMWLMFSLEYKYRWTSMIKPTIGVGQSAIKGWFIKKWIKSCYSGVAHQSAGWCTGSMLSVTNKNYTHIKPFSQQKTKLLPVPQQTTNDITTNQQGNSHCTSHSCDSGPTTTTALKMIKRQINTNAYASHTLIQEIKQY